MCRPAERPGCVSGQYAPSPMGCPGRRLLRIDWPTTFELAIERKSVPARGLAIAQPVALRARVVIE
jgi:hypothetical protein